MVASILYGSPSNKKNFGIRHDGDDDDDGDNDGGGDKDAPAPGLRLLESCVGVAGLPATIPNVAAGSAHGPHGPYVGFFSFRTPPELGPSSSTSGAAAPCRTARRW